MPHKVNAYLAIRGVSLITLTTSERLRLAPVAPRFRRVTYCYLPKCQDPEGKTFFLKNIRLLTHCNPMDIGKKKNKLPIIHIVCGVKHLGPSSGGFTKSTNHNTMKG